MRHCLALLLMLVATAVAPASRAQSPEPETLRIHGSNTLGRELVPRLAAAWLARNGYQDVRRTVAGPGLTRIDAIRDGEPVRVEIVASSTGEGLAHLVDGSANIAMSARSPTAAELDAAWQLGDLGSPAQEWVVALDGLVVVAGADAPASLTLAQLRDVVSGRTRDWSQVGGRPGPVRLHLGATGSRADELLSQWLSGRRPDASALRHASLGGVVDAVARDRGAVGLVSLTTPTRGFRRLAISEGGSAVRPGALSIRSEDYPLTRRLVLHTGQMVGALGRGFVEFAVSQAGQAVVERSGHVSLRLRAMPGVQEPPAAGEYAALVAGARRLPTTLRFSGGLDLFDSRSRQDVERLAAFVREPGNAARVVLLVGFADPSPRVPYQSLALSQERVDFVAGELLSQGLRVVSVRGLGGRQNLAALGGAASRYRNERVEVWVR